MWYTRAWLPFTGASAGQFRPDGRDAPAGRAGAATAGWGLRGKLPDAGAALRVLAARPVAVLGASVEAGGTLVGDVVGVACGGASVAVAKRLRSGDATATAVTIGRGYWLAVPGCTPRKRGPTRAAMGATRNRSVSAKSRPYPCIVETKTLIPVYSPRGARPILRFARLPRPTRD